MNDSSVSDVILLFITYCFNVNKLNFRRFDNFFCFLQLFHNFVIRDIILYELTVSFIIMYL